MASAGRLSIAGSKWNLIVTYGLVSGILAWALLTLGWISPAGASTGAPTTSGPEWGALWAFPIALVITCVLAVIFFWRAFPGKSPNQSLEHLEKTWSFSESWVSNVTVIGGLLSGIFGSSEVITALLGTETKSAVALATVGAAAAVFFTASGPVMVAATRSKVGNYVTAGGLLAGAAVTLAGASGELWVLYRSGAHLDLGGWQHRIIVLAILAEVLLALYAVRSLLATLELGLNGEQVPPPTNTISAISDAMIAHTNVDLPSLGTAMTTLAQAHPQLATTPLMPATHIRRSAVL